MFVCIMILIMLMFNHKFYQPPILGDLKLRYISSQNYHLLYKGHKIGETITAVDSWYINGSSVFGSSTDYKLGSDSLVYFFVDVCSGEAYTTTSYATFDDFLDKRNIPKNQRNWMSGINAIDIKKAEYSSKIDCNR